MDNLERRYTRGTVELRSAEGGPGVLRGYAAVYDKLSQNLGGFVERIMPAAFTKALADRPDILCRYNHSDAMLLGRTSSGTLRVGNDERGMPYEVDLPDTTVGRDVSVLAARGDLRNSSFAFMVVDGGDSWGTTERGFPLRTINAARVIDVAPVNTPAYLDTTVGLRSLADALATDLDTVARLAKRNELAGVITHDLPTVGTRSSGEDGEQDGQREPHPNLLQLRQLRSEWDKRRI